MSESVSTNQDWHCVACDQYYDNFDVEYRSDGNWALRRTGTRHMSGFCCQELVAVSDVAQARARKQTDLIYGGGRKAGKTWGIAALREKQERETAARLEAELAKAIKQHPGEGRKDDKDKPYRMELIAPEMLFALSAVLTPGARKYADRNWEQGMGWGRCFGAAMRHLWAWWGGAAPTPKSFLFGDLDPEWNFSHLWHAACCLMFLIAYEERGIGTDDRWKGVVK